MKEVIFMMYGNNGAAYQNGGNYYNQNQGMNMPLISQMQPQVQNGSMISGLNWVQGDAGAKAWYVAPGTGAVLLDSEDNVMYIKYADQMGRPTLLKKCYEDFVDEAPLALPQNSSAPAPSMDMSEYIRREEVEDMITREVEKRMNDMQQSKTGRGRSGSTNA
jgi:hypothetical protein